MEHFRLWYSKWMGQMHTNYQTLRKCFLGNSCYLMFMRELQNILRRYSSNSKRTDQMRKIKKHDRLFLELQ